MHSLFAELECFFLVGQNETGEKVELKSAIDNLKTVFICQDNKEYYDA